MDSCIDIEPVKRNRYRKISDITKRVCKCMFLIWPFSLYGCITEIVNFVVHNIPITIFYRESVDVMFGYPVTFLIFNSCPKHANSLTSVSYSSEGRTGGVEFSTDRRNRYQSKEAKRRAATIRATIPGEGEGQSREGTWEYQIPYPAGPAQPGSIPREGMGVNNYFFCFTVNPSWHRVNGMAYRNGFVKNSPALRPCPFLQTDQVLDEDIIWILHLHWYCIDNTDFSSWLNGYFHSALELPLQPLTRRRVMTARTSLCLLRDTCGRRTGKEGQRQFPSWGVIASSERAISFVRARAHKP